MKPSRTQFVYLIGSTGSPLVKIGTTNDLGRRLRDIQNMSPAPLSVLWHAEGGLALEQALHSRFGKYRKHGEWFDFGRRDPIALVSTAAAELAHLAHAPKAKPPQLLVTSEDADSWLPSAPMVIAREFLLDEHISGLTRGIGAYLLARTGSFTITQIAEANGCSEDEVRAALSELTELNYACVANGKLHFDGWPMPMERADRSMPGYDEYGPEG